MNEKKMIVEHLVNEKKKEKYELIFMLLEMANEYLCEILEYMMTKVLKDDEQ